MWIILWKSFWKAEEDFTQSAQRPQRPQRKIFNLKYGDFTLYIPVPEYIFVEKNSKAEPFSARKYTVRRYN